MIHTGPLEEVVFGGFDREFQALDMVFNCKDGRAIHAMVPKGTKIVALTGVELQESWIVP